MERRNTIQKELVLNAVQTLRNHATAEEIYQSVVEVRPSVSRGTVYHNLKTLEEEGKIQRVEIANEADRYDHLCEPHYHVLCVRCGRVYDVDMDILPDVIEKIKDRHGFEFLDYDVKFRGICPDCLTKNHKESQL